MVDVCTVYQAVFEKELLDLLGRLGLVAQEVENLLLTVSHHSHDANVAGNKPP